MTLYEIISHVQEKDGLFALKRCGALFGPSAPSSLLKKPA